MEMLISEDSEFDDSTVDKAIDLKISLQLVTHSLPRKTQEYMSVLLQKYLNECGKGIYFNKLDYCLSEILLNALKANMKRVYFKKHNLDINNPEDYQKGMETFRTDILDDKDYYLKLLRDGDLYVIYKLQIDEEKLIIEVRNNSVMTEIESERVKQKIADTHTMVYDEVVEGCVDETEGAGLGISSILLALRSFGLPGDHYQLYTEGNETVARLIIEDPLEELEEN